MRGVTRRTSSPTVALFAKARRLFAYDPTLHPVAPCGHTVAHGPSAKVADSCQAYRYFPAAGRRYPPAGTVANLERVCFVGRNVHGDVHDEQHAPDPTRQADLHDLQHAAQGRER